MRPETQTVNYVLGFYRSFRTRGGILARRMSREHPRPAFSRQRDAPPVADKLALLDHKCV